MREHAADSRPYEMMVILPPTVADEGLQAAIDRVSTYVTNQGGTVLTVNHQNPWGRRRLAYPIQDFRDAYYVLYEFDAQAEAILEIEREIKLDEQVIRHLVVRYDEMAEQEDQPKRGQGSAQAQAPEGEAPAAAQADEAQSQEAQPAGEASAETPAATADEAEAAGETSQDEPETAEE